MRDKPITARELVMSNRSRCQAKKAKDFSSTDFWYYTSLKTANLILKNHCFHVNNFDNMNDNREADLHDTERQYTHALCFCNSDSEKIPMWYLYAGIAGRGISIGFTPSTMLKMMRSIKTITTVDKTVTLEKGKDFDLDFGWVYYRKENNPSKIFYRRNWYEIVDSTDDFQEGNYFIKDYPWEYEKEFRFIIRNKTGTPYDKLVINLPTEFYNALKIKLAPEITEAEFLSLVPELDGFHLLLKKKLLQSSLGINMKLCNKNFSSFVEYVEAELKEGKHSANYEGLCKLREMFKGIEI